MKPETPMKTDTPTKWRSPRRCSNGGENLDGNSLISKSPKKSPRKRLSDQLSPKARWNPRDPVQMQAVKEALHVATSPTNVFCREEEQRKVLEFCKACIEEENAGSLYVCGCPGTGKTMSLNKVKEHLVVWSKEVWSWTRLAIGVPTCRTHTQPDPLAPLGYRYNVDRTWDTTPNRSIKFFRDELDMLTEEGVQWTPYMIELVHVLPPLCLESPLIWRSRTTLVCFSWVALHMLDRVLRQFYRHQYIPEPSWQPAHISSRGRPDADWPALHAEHIQRWNSRADLVVDEILHWTPRADYLGWYWSITRRFITSRCLPVYAFTPHGPLQRDLMGYQTPDMITINCTSLSKTSEIFGKILGSCLHQKKMSDSLLPLQQLQKLFSQKKQPSCKKMMLLIVDEMDYLITRDRAVLHDLFMLTTFPFSRCILVGIANAIDLADRFLPKLEALNCKPSIVTFRAYSKDQILKILQQRLAVLEYDVFQPSALEFCARKVAAASGDMRSAIEVLESELRDATTMQELDMVRFNHMDIALSRAFKSAVVDTIQSLPQHQQILLCSLVNLFRQCKKKDTTIGELNKSYLEICKSTQVPAVGMLEFTSMCGVLNDQGLVKLGKSREDRLKRVTLQIDSSDVIFAFKGNRFFSELLRMLTVIT